MHSTSQDEGLVRPYPDASRFLACSRAHVFKLMREGRLPYVAIGMSGSDRRIPIAALRKFVESNTVCANGGDVDEAAS